MFGRRGLFWLGTYFRVVWLGGGGGFFCGELVGGTVWGGGGLYRHDISPVFTGIPVFLSWPRSFLWKSQNRFKNLGDF